MGLFALATCGAADDSALADLGLVVRVNDASDEVLLSIADEAKQGLVTVDDSRAVQLVSPEPGAQVPASAPPQFAWSSPAARPRHGTTTGEFVWLRLSGGGLSRSIDVIAVDTSNWTPDAATWAELSQATGSVTITLTSAYVDGGTIMEGPFRPSTSGTFSIAH